MSTALPELFLHEHFLARRQVFKIFGAGFHLYAPDGHLIAYSLGNFIGYHTLSGGGVLNDSGIIRVTLSVATGRVTAARWIPVTLDGGLPRRTRGDGDAPLVAQLSREDFPRSHFDVRPDGRFDLPRR